MSKYFLASSALAFCAGILSFVLEAIFYGGRLDENNVVQESFFLPLAFIFLAFGLISLVVFVVLKILKR
ncbi:DUF3955 domain-containing protein [Maritalea sp.]|uniref:DUF3955 domain-containing protein n=1 Tax=Maritalea sp. TaxID=2003361 RepID=UPI003EFAA758